MPEGRFFMAFAVGDEVFVDSLRRKGRIVEAGPGRRYRVAVGAVTAWCNESQLSVAETTKRKGRRVHTDVVAPGGARAAAEVARHATQRERQALASIDLHGMTVEEALRAVEARLDEAIRAGIDRLEIIHGISGGRLRAAVRGYLAGIGSVKRLEADPRNAGVTLVYL